MAEKSMLLVKENGKERDFSFSLFGRELFYYLGTLSRGMKKMSRKHGMQGEENK